MAQKRSQRWIAHRVRVAELLTEQGVTLVDALTYSSKAYTHVTLRLLARGVNSRGLRYRGCFASLIR